MLLDQRELAGEVKTLADRVNGLSDRAGQISKRVDRLAARHRDLEAKVSRLTEIIKWSAFAAMVLAGAWEKVPEPLRQRLLGG